MTNTVTPRKINPAETYDRLVSWIKNRAEKDKMPGMIIGVSGTDSLLVFLAAYHAFNALGRPEAVSAVNFVHPGHTTDNKITCAGNDDKDWFARDIMPWLQETAPHAQYILDDTIDFSDDNKRWGNIFSRAISDTNLNHGMLGNYRLVAGTRNRTEAMLGTYTLLSRAPSIQPIEHLYKTEVLDICAYLNMPQIALRKSREVDCDCGRFDVQAHHLDELDYYIMTQQNILDPQFLDTLPSDVLTAVRSFYHEERQNNAFREQIPYRPTPRKTVYANEDIETAMLEVTTNTDQIKAISIVTPRIIIDRDAEHAHEIVTAPSQNRTKWQAEAFTLLGTKGLENPQISNMLSHIFENNMAKIDKTDQQNIAETTAHIGQYGFSFPSKRFTTQRFAQGASLIERAGFTRQDRPTDMRDPSLPPSNPKRDALGVGFTWFDDHIYIEQRRAYLLYAILSGDAPVTILMRNSSHFFGRDRLQHAAYVSYGAKDVDMLLNLTVDDIDDAHQFTPWQNIVNADLGIALCDKMQRVNLALKILDQVDLKFAQWLRSPIDRFRFKSDHDSIQNMFGDTGGLHHLRALIKDMLLKHVEDERAGSPLFLAQLNSGEVCPWQPHRICPITTDTLAQLKNFDHGIKMTDDKLRALFTPLKKRPLILMSGPYGDFPVNWS